MRPVTAPKVNSRRVSRRSRIHAQFPFDVRGQRCRHRGGFLGCGLLPRAASVRRRVRVHGRLQPRIIRQRYPESGVGNNWFRPHRHGRDYCTPRAPFRHLYTAVGWGWFLSRGNPEIHVSRSAGWAASSGSASPAATFFADLDGVVEIVCGTGLLGLLTRVAAVPLLIDMVGAIVLTQTPSTAAGRVSQGRRSFWGMAHAARTDLADAARIDLPAWSGPGRGHRWGTTVQTRHGLRREVNPRRRDDAPDSTTSQLWSSRMTTRSDATNGSLRAPAVWRVGKMT